MRNYIILNGNNSNEIAGLLIQKLPPISQPEIRTNIEEIDGRDGDIITKLGYSAYNKEISIGLYGNYNVDDVIAYFTNNQNGQITFSNEPDKYYNYEILEQIDYEKLIRYRTATITLHCQPFKYSTTEEKIQINATEVTGSGSSITLNNTEDGAMFTNLQINGDTSQDGTPTPSNPIEVNVVTGDNTIITSNKNLCYKAELQGTQNIRFYFRKVTQKNIVCSFTVNEALNNNSLYLIVDGTGYGIISFLTVSANTKAIVTITLTDAQIAAIQGGTEMWFLLYKSGASFVVPDDAQIELGSTATNYVEHEEQDYTISLGTTELCKIGDYQDKIYKTSGKNIFDMATAVQSSYGYHSNTGTLTHIDNNTIKIVKGITSSDHRLTIANNVNISSGTTINISWKYASGNGNVIAQIQALDKDNNIINLTSLNNNGLTSPQQITLSTDITYIWLGTAWNNNSDLVISNIMINKGITATEYEPYGSGKWYLHKETKKIVLDGTQSSSSVNTSSTNTTRVQYNHYADGVATTLNGYCNQLTFARNWSSDTEGVCYDPSNGGFWFRINKTTIGTTASEVNTYLSNNNLICYIPLATPTDTEITDTTLLSQLEALESATTYLGETNINTSGSDLSPLLDVTTYSVDNTSFTITNSGNIYSKPIITIYGVGTIGLYLNGIQVLSLDMGETTSQITIDVAKLEAYNQETGALMNRNVTGDYNNLSLNVGENTITESGTLQGLEVENYSRWL